MYKRSLASRFPPKHSFFLLGPRQVGKSTLLSALNTSLKVDLLEPELQLAYSRQPSRLGHEIEAVAEKNGWILIDEIQRVPALLDVIHQQMEKYPKLKFALSGSSARKLRHGAANLLGGRALYKHLYPLTAAELGKDFSLDRVLACGSLPKIYSTLLAGEADLARELLRAYFVVYLREEVKAEALVRNLPGFQNFLDVAAAQFSEQVNFTAVSRDCGVAYATVREFYSILEDTLMGFFLRPFLRSERKRMSHAAKFYFFDNGVTRAIQGVLNAPPSPLERGRLYEQWCLQEIVRLNEYGRKDWKLSFWRTSHGAEVDLILERGRQILAAIEFKHKTNIGPSDFTGLKAFHDVFPKVPLFLAAPVPRAQQIQGIRIEALPSCLEKLAEL